MDSTEQKKCYYDILEVDIKATEDEIKRSFKKLSLKNHPDRNRNNIEEAKQRYQEITEAYNVISDPKQRDWYDKNREKLLVNKSDLTKEELQQQAYGFDIFAHMAEDCFEGYDESEKGFYTVYGKAFDTLNNEEEKVFKFISKKDEVYQNLPKFGDSKSDIKDVVAFYDTWKNFTCIKTFAYIDQHDARDAENRYEKRQMEQENERERKREKKKYVQNVKDLVAFVKKLDPRREQLIELQKQEEEKILQQRELFKSDKQKKKEAKQREQDEKKKQKELEEQKRFEEQEQQRLQLLAEQEKLQKETQSQEFICKVCEKSFESSKKLGNHRKSQQHKDEVAKQQGDQDKKEAEQAQADEETLKALRAVDPSKLTKKQAKELKKLEAQEKAKKTQKVQQQKKEQKTQEQTQENQEQEKEEEDDDEEHANDGEKKKRKRNKKKKTGQAEEEQQTNGRSGTQQQIQSQSNQQQEDDGWNQIQGSAKTMKKVNQENKKQKKSSGDAKI